jgi:hypothetical protein
MSLVLVIAALFDMIRRCPDEISIIIVKVGCVFVDATRPHELTPYEMELIENPAKYIVGYSGQKVNLYVLLIDNEYTNPEHPYPVMIENDEHYIWNIVPTASSAHTVYHSCVIPADIQEDALLTIFADFKKVGERMPLSIMVLMDFTGIFSNIKVDYPKVFTGLPGECFTDVRAPIYKVVFNIKDGILLPFRIADSEGLTFVNTIGKDDFFKAASSAMIHQFMWRKRIEIAMIDRILRGINFVTLVTKEKPETRFSYANVLSLLDSPNCVMENLYFRISKDEIKAYLQQIVVNWLSTKTDGTLFDVLGEIYDFITFEIIKVNAVPGLCHIKNYEISSFNAVSETIAKAFPFMTTEGSPYYAISF